MCVWGLGDHARSFGGEGGGDNFGGLAGFRGFGLQGSGFRVQGLGFRV